MRTSVTGRVLAALVAAATVAFVAGCNNNNTTPVTPTTPSTPSVTENFTGELLHGQTKIHTFSVGKGVVTTTVTSLAPVATTDIGVAYGLWDGTNCNDIKPNPVASSLMIQGSSLVGTATTAVTLCLRVYDVGNIPDGTTYTYGLTVVHY